MKCRQIRCFFTENRKNGQCILELEEEIAGRISWWTESVPEGVNHEKIGVFGMVQADDEEAAKELFEAVYQRMKSLGVQKVIGPMDHNTWNNYGFLVNTTRMNPFFLEPFQPVKYSEWVKKAGWKELVTYYSLNARLEDFHRPESQRVDLYEKEGIVLQDASRFKDAEMFQILYQLSIQCFTECSYFMPADFKVFCERYEPLLQFFRKEYIYIAWKGSQPVAFLLSFPDYKEADNLSEIKTIVVKMFGVLPEYQNKGIATVLINQAAKQARDDGMEEMVMAQIQEGSFVAHMMPDAEICSTYVLYEKE